MRWIESMSLGKKLVGSFALLCLLLLGIVALSVVMMERLFEGTESIAQDRLPKVLLVYDTQTQVDAIALSLRNMMLNDEAQDRERQMTRIVEARRQIEQNFAKLDRIIALPEGIAILRRMQEQRARYAQGQEHLLERIRGGTAEEARAVLNGELRPILTEFKAAFADMIRLQVRWTEQRSALAGTDYRATRNGMLGLGGVALLLAIGVTILLTRHLLGVLGGEPAYAARVAEAVAEGDLSLRTELRAGDQRSLLSAMERMRHNLAELVGQVRNSAQSIATGAAEIATGNQDLSARTEQQAAALEETASSMEELTATVRQNAEHAQTASRLAEDVSHAAGQGGEAVAQVVASMERIRGTSGKIADIIGVIDGIAFQTNILALNAAVEAARAGEQGRGFAVVAGEVRNLAQRSANAAREIKALIGASVEEVAHGGELAHGAGRTMENLVTQIRQVAGIIQEISTASHEQSAGIMQVNDAITRMDEGTQQNAALVEEAAAAAASLNEQAAALARMVAVFRLVQGVRSGR